MADGIDYYLNMSKQMGISYLFSFLTIIFQLLLVAILTRKLSIQEFGVYSLLSAALAILNSFLRFGIESYITTKIPGLEDEKRVRTIITILFFFSLFLLTCSLLLFFLRDMVATTLNIQEYISIWLLFVPLAVALTFFDIITYYLLSIKKIVISSFLRFLCQCLWIIVLVIFFFMVERFSLKLVFVPWLINVLIISGLSIFFIRHEIARFIKDSFQFNWLQLKEIVFFSAPLVIVTVFTLTGEYTNRFLINHFLGKTEVAWYSLASSLVGFALFMPYVIQGVIQPYFNEKWNLKQDPSLLFNILVKYSLLFILPAAAGLFVLRKEIILLLSNGEYLPAAPLVSVLLIFPIFNIMSLLFTQTMYLRNLSRRLLLINGIALTIDIVFNLIFLPKIGVISAAYGVVLSSGFIFLALFVLRPKEIILQWKYLKILPILVASLIMGTIISPINPEDFLSKVLVIVFGVGIYAAFLFLLRVFTQEEMELIRRIYRNIKSQTIKPQITPKKDVLEGSDKET